jgi:dTMP kinase
VEEQDNDRMVQELKTKQKGVFICIEGLDGSGKTTQAQMLVETLKKEGLHAVYTAEPSNGVFGKILKENILTGNKRFPVVEAVLFAVDRIDHIESEIRPLLHKGKIVVSDRYIYSSIAYQGATNLSRKWLREINRLALKPDLMILIDISAEKVLERIKGQKSIMETLHTQRMVREAYLDLAEKDGLQIVDGNTIKKEVSNKIHELVLKFLKSNIRYKY